MDFTKELMNFQNMYVFVNVHRLSTNLHHLLAHAPVNLLRSDIDICLLSSLHKFINKKKLLELISIIHIHKNE